MRALGRRKLVQENGKSGARIYNLVTALSCRFLVNSMTTIFNTNSICSWTGGRDICSQRWLFDPDILALFASQRNYDLLTYVWKAWRDAVGPAIRPFFMEEVGLRNLKARAMGFDDWGAVWRSLYETPNFSEEADRLFYEILPLYEQLYVYVRRRLRETYRNRFGGAAIPAHILGMGHVEPTLHGHPYSEPFRERHGRRMEQHLSLYPSVSKSDQRRCQPCNASSRFRPAEAVPASRRFLYFHGSRTSA